MAHANVTCPGTNSSFYLQSAPHPPLSSWRLSICRCSGKNSRASLTSLPTHLRQIHQPILLVVHLLSISKLYHSCHLGCFHPNSGPNNPGPPTCSPASTLSSHSLLPMQKPQQFCHRGSQITPLLHSKPPTGCSSHSGKSQIPQGPKSFVPFPYLPPFTTPSSLSLLFSFRLPPCWSHTPVDTPSWHLCICYDHSRNGPPHLAPHSSAHYTSFNLCSNTVFPDPTPNKTAIPGPPYFSSLISSSPQYLSIFWCAMCM